MPNYMAGTSDQVQLLDDRHLRDHQKSILVPSHMLPQGRHEEIRMPYNPNSEWICIDRELYEQMHKHVFKHTYVRFGDQAYVQTLSTPMGVAASVNNSHNF